MFSLITLIAGVVSAGPYAATPSYGKGYQPQPRPASSMSCPPQYRLEGKMCVSNITEAAQGYCPGGMMQGPGGCIATAPLMQNCPYGSSPSGKGCSIEEFADLVASCPIGYSDNGKTCSKQVNVAPVPSCPPGSQMYGGQCKISESAPMQTSSSCPAGYMQEGGKGCVRTSTYDCTPPQRPGKKNLRFLGHKSGSKKHSAPAYTGKKGVPAPQIQVVQQTCERKEYADMITQSFCPQGFTSSGKACTRTSSLPAQMICPGGGMAGGKGGCSRMETSPKAYNCPSGYQAAGKSRKCIKRRSVPMQSSCPPGFNQGGKGGCTRSQPMQYKCRNGLQLQGNMCVGTKTTEPIVTTTVTCVGKGCEKRFHH